MFAKNILNLLTTTSTLIASTSATTGDWTSNWSSSTPSRTLASAFDVDPYDARSTMRGSGQVTLGNGIARFNGSPRLYISQVAGVDGWENVEMTAYGKYVDQGSNPKTYSGLTMVTRTNHDDYKNAPCEAFGYYARIYQESGECAFQKEYYHSESEGTVYTPTKRVDCFPGGLPLGVWVGMKFKVITQPNTSDVLLQLYLDEVGNGNWQLRHEVTDTPGYWFSSTSKTVPSQCPQNDGDTVLRPGNVSFLRTDGGDETTEVHWRDASMMNSLTSSNTVPTSSPTNQPTKAPTPAGTPTNPPTNPPFLPSDPTCLTGIQKNDVCCSAECGSCGGSGCSSRPGGSDSCCTSTIISANNSCNNNLPPCLIDPTATAHPTSVPTNVQTTSPTMKPIGEDAPTSGPTKAPSKKPTASPSMAPSKSPSKQPTEYPTASPTDQPTKAPTPAVSPTNSPFLTSDPTCSTGIQDKDVCCSIECGACGGVGCSSLPGGADNCCTGTITSVNRSCNNYPPPCVIDASATAHPTSGPTNASTTTASPTNQPTKAPVISPTVSSETKYLCKRHPQSTTDICSVGQPTSGSQCTEEGAPCGGQKKCWIASCGTTIFN